MRAALAFLIALFAALPLNAEEIVAGLSTDRFEISSNFTGGSLIVFGTINRDAQTIARAGQYDVVIVVTGPRDDIVTRRKGRALGIWVNQASVTFDSAPLYFATLTSSPIEDIAQPASLRRFGIGVNHMPLKIFGIASDEAQFRDAFVRLKSDDTLYVEKTDAVSFLSRNLFTATVPLPATVPIGSFTVDIYAFRDGALVGQTSDSFRVEKTGFEQFMYDLAHNQPMLYGIAAVLLAIFTGWAAGVIFRRD